MKREETVVDRAGRGDVALKRRLNHFMHQLRSDVRGHRDHALAACEHESESRVIVTGVKREVLILRKRGKQRLSPGDVTRRVLQADNAGNLSEAQHGVVRHIAARTARNVIEDHRQPALSRHGGEMLEETFLRGLVVVRDHLQGILSADFKRFTR